MRAVLTGFVVTVVLVCVAVSTDSLAWFGSASVAVGVSTMLVVHATRDRLL